MTTPATSLVGCSMTDWKLGQYVRVWRNEGYEYWHIGGLSDEWVCGVCDGGPGNCCQCHCDPQYQGEDEAVMLVGDDGREIYARVKDLEAGE